MEEVTTTFFSEAEIIKLMADSQHYVKPKISDVVVRWSPIAKGWLISFSVIDDTNCKIHLKAGSKKERVFRRLNGVEAFLRKMGIVECQLILQCFQNRNIFLYCPWGIIENRNGNKSWIVANLHIYTILHTTCTSAGLDLSSDVQVVQVVQVLLIFNSRNNVKEKYLIYIYKRNISENTCTTCTTCTVPYISRALAVQVHLDILHMCKIDETSYSFYGVGMF